MLQVSFRSITAIAIIETTHRTTRDSVSTENAIEDEIGIHGADETRARPVRSLQRREAMRDMKSTVNEPTRPGE